MEWKTPYKNTSYGTTNTNLGVPLGVGNEIKDLLALQQSLPVPLSLRACGQHSLLETANLTVAPNWEPHIMNVGHAHVLTMHPTDSCQPYQQ